MSKSSLSKIFSTTKTGHSVLVAVTVITVITKGEKWGKKKIYNPLQNTASKEKRQSQFNTRWLENRTLSMSLGILDKKWAVYVTGQMEDKMPSQAAGQKPPQNQFWQIEENELLSATAYLINTEVV